VGRDDFSTRRSKRAEIVASTISSAIDAAKANLDGPITFISFKRSIYELRFVRNIRIFAIASALSSIRPIRKDRFVLLQQ
jgi:hypothetical protein